MKNILNENPLFNKYEGRILRTISFVDKFDILKKTTLDYGCGYGWFSNYLLKKNASTIFGVDYSDEDLSTARYFLRNKKINFFKLDDFNKKNYKEKFDSIFAWEVLEHLPKNSEKKFFILVNSLLKKKGVFYLSTPHLHFFSFLDPAFIFGHRHYSKKQIINFVESSSLKIEKLEIYGGWWNIISIINFYFSKWVLKRAPIFGLFFAKKETKEYMKPIGFTNLFLKVRKI